MSARFGGRPNGKGPARTGLAPRCSADPTQTLRRELPFASIEHAQQAVDAFVADYNTHRPHQALAMDRPADRFRPRHEDTLPLRLPPALRAVGDPDSEAAPEPHPEPLTMPPTQAETAELAAADADQAGLAVEFTLVVPASGNLAVCGQQFWLGTHRAGLTLTLRADIGTVELLAGGVRIKNVPSRLTPQHLKRLIAEGGQRVGPAAKPARHGTGEAVEVDRTINASGMVALGGQQYSVGYQFAGRRLTVRIDGAVLHLSDGHTLLRTLPKTLASTEMARLRDARPAGPEPQPAAEPVRGQRRVRSRASSPSLGSASA
ncbi:integrase core domain-containing protein [Nonomuraea diastatica]|uniref:Integrase catalytic domain-containing protein n=1 Tax=Nonomuraea diastatica TaxID=1848329 RepID=A0A4R4VS45_9ACTN|nr:hypothetical protein E1294_50930 [Nonomuraea diastatica]